MKRTVFLSFSWLIVVALCVVIFYFSGQIAVDSSAQSMWLIDWIYKIFGVGFTDHVIRKSAHFLEYTALGFFFANAIVYSFKNIRKIYLSVLFSFMYAVSDEIHQYFVPGRACRFKDMMIDLAGIAVGSLCFAGIYLIMRRLGEKKNHVSRTQSS